MFLIFEAYSLFESLSIIVISSKRFILYNRNSNIPLKVFHDDIFFKKIRYSLFQFSVETYWRYPWYGNSGLMEKNFFLNF